MPYDELAFVTSSPVTSWPVTSGIVTSGPRPHHDTTFYAGRRDDGSGSGSARNGVAGAAPLAAAPLAAAARRGTRPRQGNDPRFSHLPLLATLTRPRQCRKNCTRAALERMLYSVICSLGVCHMPPRTTLVKKLSHGWTDLAIQKIYVYIYTHTSKCTSSSFLFFFLM